jgi:hypothetical protein
MWGRGPGVLLTKVSRQSSGPIFKYIDSSWTSRTLKMTPIHCLEALGTNHLLPRRHIPEERWRRLHHCGSLETTIKLKSRNKIPMKSAQLNSFLLLVLCFVFRLCVSYRQTVVFGCTVVINVPCLLSSIICWIKNLHSVCTIFKCTVKIYVQILFQ